MSSAYLTVAAVADQAGFSPRTVLRWVERGDLEAIRFPGGRLRISQTAWNAFLAERTTTNGTRTLVAVDQEGDE
jgi:excisionase family DNA binding protein